MKNSKAFLLLLTLAWAVMASSCTRHVSRGFTVEGDVHQAIFPEEMHLGHDGGSVPNPANLRLLGEGLSKDQLRGLIGTPHFREGFAAREWDYLFLLQSGEAGTVKCRLKVRFDERMRARSLVWAPSDCARLIAGPAVVTPAVEAPAAPRRISLSADLLFPFGKWAIHDMNPAGHERVQQIAAELRGLTEVEVKVLGHADRIGNEHANRLLSQRRADTVRQVLVAAGVPEPAIFAQGLGVSRQAACREGLSRAELIACLAPDRRVEIVVIGAG